MQAPPGWGVEEGGPAPPRRKRELKFESWRLVWAFGVLQAFKKSWGGKRKQAVSGGENWQPFLFYTFPLSHHFLPDSPCLQDFPSLGLPDTHLLCFLFSAVTDAQSCTLQLSYLSIFLPGNSRS